MKSKDIIAELGAKMILKQFELIGVPMTIEQLQGIETWYWDYTLTDEQATEWREWCVKETKKATKWRIERVQKELSFFFLNYELRIKND
jgi:hypothetical protein